jgi:hypothetical protein
MHGKKKPFAAETCTIYLGHVVRIFGAAIATKLGKIIPRLNISPPNKDIKNTKNIIPGK